ncbi:GIY-YIG nuclease family protein [Lysinibacillus piscis]|uniref:GIY-YIG domain-containing protein n=1 Tax=Lysinibacillus piscis TaxID=2518931 RepID=A0ABQ5NQ64_9BACI|nr:GIY-YIG nuclease family protein [Lysinibacillus sp. KH24]GLC90463.1 hypothetical protein LYSBPC_35900 [Lysinibacillus sp. KH24]
MIANYSLTLSDILKKGNFDLRRVRLLRHSMNHKRFKMAYDVDCILEYTKMQVPDFYHNVDLVLNFVGDQGTTAKLVGCYKPTHCSQKIEEQLFPSKMPKILLEHPTNIYHELEQTSYYHDLINRLYIDWGKGTVNWSQSALNDKPIIAIKSVPTIEFKGYERVMLMYGQLEQIIESQVTYENWHDALKAVHAVYLITDLAEGRQYVGSAYGADSLFQRWETYVKTKHGNNKKIIEYLKQYPERYHEFQFSILQIIPKNSTQKDVIELENLYKEKLGTRLANGLNDN